MRGKRVLITGASMGIGEQMAYYYAKLGSDLLITSRTEAKLQQAIRLAHKSLSQDIVCKRKSPKISLA